MIRCYNVFDYKEATITKTIEQRKVCVLATSIEMESNLENAYMQAFLLASQKIALTDPGKIADAAGVPFYNDGFFKLKYINKEYLIGHTTSEFLHDAFTKPPTTPEKVLMLHYLVHSTSLKNSTGTTHISFKEVKGGGAIYYPTFVKRTINPLIKVFGNNPVLLAEAARVLNGRNEKFGSSSVTIDIFPKVPVTYIVWQGDNEIPSNATVLFREDIENHLPGEDIVLAASYGAYELIRSIPVKKSE